MGVAGVLGGRRPLTCAPVAVLALQCAVETEVGRRENNEDTAFASPRLAVVADGVGGAASGEVASRAVVNALISLDTSRPSGPLDVELLNAVTRGNDTVRFIAACHPEHTGMSTTLTAVALDDDGQYVVVNVGDSRTYLYRDRELRQLTRDDSLVQELIDQGALSAGEARHHPQRSVVLVAVDGRARLEPRLFSLEALAGDRLLLCSDGLSDALQDSAIAATMALSGRQECARSLVAQALAAGGSDNITVIVADVAGENGGSRWRPAH